MSKMDADLNEVLNLNCPTGSLIGSRKAALQTIQKNLHGLQSDKAVKNRLLKLRDHYNQPQEELTAYVGIIRWYIDRKLKKLGRV